MCPTGPLGVDEESFGMVLTELESLSRARFGIPDSLGSGVVVSESTGCGMGPEAHRLRPGDVILSANRIPIISVAQFRIFLRRLSRNGNLMLLVNRQGTSFFAMLRPRAVDPR